MAILTIHEIRQVFKLPLRQCEGLVNSLFKLVDLQWLKYFLTLLNQPILDVIL